MTWLRFGSESLRDRSIKRARHAFCCRRAFSGDRAGVLTERLVQWSDMGRSDWINVAPLPLTRDQIATGVASTAISGAPPAEIEKAIMGRTTNMA